MNIKVMQQYLAFCEAIHVNPNFIGLKAYHNYKKKVGGLI